MLHGDDILNLQTLVRRVPAADHIFHYAKKLTRPAVSLKDWNKNWHDHAVEIAGGRVQVLDLPPDKAKEVADTVATTDGMIYHFYFDGTLPNGKTSIAQAVGHKLLTEAEYKESMAAK